MELTKQQIEYINTEAPGVPESGWDGFVQSTALNIYAEMGRPNLSGHEWEFTLNAVSDAFNAALK